jgi:acyl-CoA synthetase (AMP-forming)/AMP-acid ligase II
MPEEPTAASAHSAGLTHSAGLPHSAGLIHSAAQTTVFGLFEAQAWQFPQRLALVDGGRRLTYAQLHERVLRLAAALSALGLARFDRVALLSENRAEVLELFLAAARLGVTVACQNWRLAPAELAHCIELVEPKLLLVSDLHGAVLDGARLHSATLQPSALPTLRLGDEYEAALAAATPCSAPATISAEDPLLILYTSGTTGLPKGAVISQRAEIFRNLVMRAEFGLTAEDCFVAWSPLYHMGATDPALGALMSGGKVITVGGFERDVLAELVASERLGWLLLMPGMVSAFADELERRNIVPKGVKLCGVMADLVPTQELARITRLLGAPYANTFGATETGCPPCSSSLIPVGVAPTRLSKQKSPFCEVRLVDSEDHDVAPGQPGEICVRGPTLFSGYYRADEVNAREFRGGWFHMGDVFVLNPDGSLDFVDRVKYLIKSGGENIYPAEIERVLLQDARVLEVACVRQRDARWGEVPVVFIARKDPSLTESEVLTLCQQQLASYKRPKGIHFITFDEFPRSASGKIQRHELEKRLPQAQGRQ